MMHKYEKSPDLPEIFLANDDWPFVNLIVEARENTS